MANCFDYLLWRGDLTLTQSPFNEVDGMILARLSYVPFELIGKRPGMPLNLGDAAAALLAHPELVDCVRMENDVRLLSALAESPRFRSMELSGYVNQVAEDTQFSALTVRLKNRLYFVAYRGTDNTLAGWNEDFDMAYLSPVPAQKRAVEYLTDLARKIPGRLILGGHSKGGNLAVYAGAFCSSDIRKRIDTVYNYDGPGFLDEVLADKGYRAIRNRIRTYIPQTSIVGMFLGHGETPTVISSTQNFAPLQHDTYSWEVSRDRLVRVDSVTEASMLIDQIIKEWSAGIDYARRKQFVDAVFQMLRETNAETMDQLSENWSDSALSMARSLRHLDEPTRRAVLGVVGALVHSGGKQLQQALHRR